MKEKVVIITGVSSGMGKETAKVLAAQGHTVYGGARRVEKMKELEPLGIKTFAMDVTKEEDNRRVVEKVVSAEGRIDVLINNAGVGLYSTVEDAPIAAAKEQFEVNIFGLADLTKRVLPHMRSQRSGRIINMSSMGGRVYTPLGAWYHASKHALEGFSDCLRMEVRQFGIDVVVIQPGLIKTNFGVSVGENLSKYIEGSAYREMVDPYIELLNDPKLADMGSPAIDVAKLIAKAVNTRRPKTRYATGMMAKPFMFLRKHFGDRVYDWAIARAYL